MMKVNLIVFKKNGNKKSFSVPSSVTVIGRRQDCDLCIPISNVSRKHCQLNQDQGKLMVRDLGSTNGTLVNGTAVKEAELQAGDKLAVGPLAFSVQIDGVPSIDEEVINTPELIEADPLAESAQDFADMTGMNDLDLHASSGPGQSTTEMLGEVNLDDINRELDELG